MCDQIDALNLRVTKGDASAQTSIQVLTFLRQTRPVFEPSMWTAVSGSWDIAEKRIVDALGRRDVPIERWWVQFVHAWNLMYLAIKIGSCGASPRYAVTQTPSTGPWGGRAICAPTFAPDSYVKRSYASRGECEMALQLLYPQAHAVPNTSYVTCDQAGCDEVVDWGT